MARGLRALALVLLTVKAPLAAFDALAPLEAHVRRGERVENLGRPQGAGRRVRVVEARLQRGRERRVPRGSPTDVCAPSSATAAASTGTGTSRTLSGARSALKTFSAMYKHNARRLPRMTAPSKSTVRYASGSVAHGARSSACQTLSAVRIIASPPRFCTEGTAWSRVLRFSGRAGAKALRFVASGRAGAKARIRVQISRRVVRRRAMLL